MAREPFPFAINTYSHTASHSALDCLRHLANQGYTDFELMIYPGHLWPATTDAAARRELRALVEGEGLRIASLNMPNIDMNIAAAAEEMRRHTLGLLHAILALAGDLEVPGVVVGPGKANPLMPAPREQLMSHFLRALDELAPHAERVGTQLYVENMPFAFLPDAEGLMAALERYGDDRIAVIYDIANAVFIGEDPGAGLRRVQDRLKLVHLSDTPQRSIGTARSARAWCRSPRSRRCSTRSATVICRCSRSSRTIPIRRSAPASSGCSLWAGRAPQAPGRRIAAAARNTPIAIGPTGGHASCRRSADVVVVGAADAAMCAALAAADQGASVPVLERAPQEERSGNIHYTAGAFRVAYDGVEQLREVMADLTDDEIANTDFGTYTEDQFLGRQAWPKIAQWLG